MVPLTMAPTDTPNVDWEYMVFVPLTIEHLVIVVPGIVKNVMVCEVTVAIAELLIVMLVDPWAAVIKTVVPYGIPYPAVIKLPADMLEVIGAVNVIIEEELVIPPVAVAVVVDGKSAMVVL